MNEENKNELEESIKETENETNTVEETTAAENEENVVDEMPAEEDSVGIEIDENGAEESEENVDAVDAVEEATEDAVIDAVAKDSAGTAPVDSLDWAAAVPVTQKKNKAGIIAVAAAVVIVIAALAVLGYMILNRNPYNRKYIDVTGRTISEVAEGAGMELSEFLEMYGLPADMPANTSESAAYYSIPAGTMAQMNMMDFATLKQVLELDDSVTENTTWGEVEDALTLRKQVGEDGLEQFKEKYGLGDDVTLDTKWGEIRKRVDSVDRKERIEEEKQKKDEIGGADGSTDINVQDGANNGEPAAAPEDGASEPANAAPADAQAEGAGTVMEGTVTEDGVVMNEGGAQ
jgi:hypothetical protein